MAVLLAVAAAPSPPPLAPEASAFLATDYRPIASMEALPPPLAAGLRAELRGGAMADRRQPYQSTDVVTGHPPLPSRRFVAAGVADDRWFVAYEHGGRGHHYHLLLFDLDPGHAHPRPTFHCRGLDQRFLATLEPAFSKRAPSDEAIQRWLKHQVRTGACDPRGRPDYDF
jgi:hypothetical protein